MVIFLFPQLVETLRALYNCCLFQMYQFTSLADDVDRDWHDLLLKSLRETSACSVFPQKSAYLYKSGSSCSIIKLWWHLWPSWLLLSRTVWNQCPLTNTFNCFVRSHCKILMKKRDFFWRITVLRSLLRNTIGFYHFSPAPVICMLRMCSIYLSWFEGNLYEFIDLRSHICRTLTFSCYNALQFKSLNWHGIFFRQPWNMILTNPL